MRAGAAQLLGIAGPGGRSVVVGLQDRLACVRLAAAEDTVDGEVGRSGTFVGRGWVVWIRHDYTLISADPLSIIDMLVDEDVAIISRVPNLTLPHEGNGAVHSRPKLDGVISEGMVLDDTGIDADGGAFMTLTAMGMPQHNVPLEATVLVRMLHGTARNAVPDLYAAQQSPKIETWERCGHCLRKREGAVFMVVMAVPGAVK